MSAPASLPVSETVPEQINNGHVPLGEQSGFKKWTGLIVLSLALAIIIIDTTLLNVSLGTLIKELHTDIQNLDWVITAYALVLAAFTITGGRLGDLFGRRKMFMLGAAIFAAGSFIASISHNVTTLLIGESIIEGFGAALMMPATSSLVIANFKGKDRATAFGVWGAVAGASSAIGPLLGGFLTTHYTWRWGFRINIVMAVIVIVGSLWLIKESRDDKEKPTLDWLGVFLSSLGLLSIVFGIIESATYGWWKAKQLFHIGSWVLNLGSISIVPVAILFGLLLVAAFVWWQIKIEKQGKTPLVSMHLFRNAQFTAGTITTAILTLGMTGLVFALPVYLQAVKKLDAFHTGIAMLPLSATILVIAPLGGLLSKKISAKTLIIAGLLIDTAAILWMNFLLKPSLPVSHLVPAFILHGIGIGLIMPPISNITLSAVPVHQAGEASGINNTLRQVGGSLGSAIVGAALVTSILTNMTTGINQSKIIPVPAKQQILNVVNDPKTDVAFGGASDTVGQNASGPLNQEITFITEESTTRGNKYALVYAAMFMLVGVAAAMFLPGRKHDEEHGMTQTEDTEAPEPISKTKLAISGATAVAAIVGGILLLNHNSKLTFPESPIQAQAQSGDNPFAAFRDQQTPPISTSTPSQFPGATSTPSSAPAATTTPQIPPTKLYRSDALGFEAEIPGNSTVASEQGSEVIFTLNQKPYFSIQSYQNVGDSLDTIANQLAGSPNVSAIKKTTINGQPALSFTMNNSEYHSGMVIIHNNRLFYILEAEKYMVDMKNIKFL